MPRLSATDCLRRGLTASEAVVELSAYALSPAELGRVYGALLQNDPALFYVAPRLSYSLGGSGEVATVYPAYTLSGTDLSVARAFYRVTLQELVCQLDEAARGQARTEAETALLVHDLLAAAYDYDVRALSGEAGNRDAYTLFRDGVGVCQAYALAAIALLREAGLEADFVSSPVMDHAWVHVRVDGGWYHMDVTRDDPVAILPDGTAEAAGLVTHGRVLRSDAGMQSLGYHGYACAGGHVCTDGRYETPEAMAALSAVSSPFRAVSAGEGKPLVWVGQTAAGELLPLRVTEAGISVYAPGDIDGDGAVTPGDLLLLGGEAVPPAWLPWMRGRLVEA